MAQAAAQLPITRIDPWRHSAPPPAKVACASIGAIALPAALEDARDVLVETDQGIRGGAAARHLNEGPSWARPRAQDPVRDGRWDHPRPGRGARRVPGQSLPIHRLRSGEAVCRWRYRIRMARFVIDPPTLIHLSEGNVIVDSDHQLVAPSPVRSQALGILLRRVQAGDLAKQEALALHERMTERKIRLLGDRVSRRTAWMMALDHGWSSIEDAEYLAVTQLQADALIALGPALASIAAGIVPLAEINDLRRL